jgi:hypothetical protein
LYLKLQTLPQSSLAGAHDNEDRSLFVISEKIYSKKCEKTHRKGGQKQAKGGS